MNAYKKLINNSFTFAIGNLGSKIISLILVPLYTFYLSAPEYGTVDITTTTVTMLVPIISASIFDAVLRFAMDEDESEAIILTNSVVVSSIGIIVSLLFFPILHFFDIMSSYLVYIYIILIAQIFEKVFNQFVRAIGKVKIFALNGVLLTFTTGLYNIIFLVFLKQGISGYFIATILSYFTSIVFLILSTNLLKNIRISNFSKEVTKNMLRYSVPLVPNSVAWWLINTSSRYFILYFVGISANGLFAVASRIPALVNLINQIFTQAWQLSAIEEYNNENKSKFYSNVFKYLATFLFVGTSGIIVIIKPIFMYLFASEYYEAWIVVPFLLLGTVFSSFAGFIGTNYIAAKQSKGVLKTSIYSGIVSIILNYILIPTFGFIGAGLSSMFSFFVLFIIRFYDTKRYVELNIRWKSIVLNIFIIFLQILALKVGLSLTNEIIIEFILFGILNFINFSTFKSIFQFLKNSKNQN